MEYVVINTHKGLFQYTRLPFGISSAPGIFQRVMESLLQGIPGVIVYLDDILVTGSSEEEHLRALEQVLDRLEKAGLRIRREKCDFMSPSVIYLGHKIDAEGLHPVADKIQATVNAQDNKVCQSSSHSYLGLLSYYSKFMPNLATILTPLYQLLRKDSRWRWSQKEERFFNISKKLLTSSDVLVHYNPQHKLVLACDASAYGVGAVLSYKFPDGSERPIGYASHLLSPAERNYSQLEKEGLACIFSVKRFHSFIFGRCFDLITDHKPLLALMSEHRPTSPQASARVKRWSLLLSAYEYKLEFRGTNLHQNADALSRLPLPEAPQNVYTITLRVGTILLEHLQDSPVTANHIQRWTRQDPVLSRVLEFVQRGWPEEVEPELKPFFSRKEEMSVLKGCLLWGSRVVVPNAGREAILTELHVGHPGISKMKALSRMYVWWPGMDQDIEGVVKKCQECQENQGNPPGVPLQPWSWPSRPWLKIHIDYAGPFLGSMFLIIIDACSKWIEAVPTSSATSAATIEILRSTFARFDLPDLVVSDNGQCFVSDEFKSFLSQNGIKQLTSAPYHPSSNGLAERAVQVVKRGLKKNTFGSLSAQLAKTLLAYPPTPHTTTGVLRAELIRLDLTKPTIARDVELRKSQAKFRYDASSRDRAVGVGDRVYVKNFGRGKRWLPGIVSKAEGSVVLEIRLDDEKVVRRHKDHVRPRSAELAESETMSSSIIDSSVTFSSETADVTNESVIGSSESNVTPEVLTQPVELDNTPIVAGTEPTPQDQARATINPALHKDGSNASDAPPSSSSPHACLQ